MIGLRGVWASSSGWARAALAAVGLVACVTSSRPASGQPLRSEAAGYQVEVLVDGAPTPSFMHGGESYVLGRLGERYVLRIHNRTGRRAEAVVSIDGRDAIDGKPANFRIKRGYLVPAWGSVDVEGWRLSGAQVAAFRFSSVADSYAARTGSAREVGVIGVAMFPERIHRPRPRPQPFEPYREGPADAASRPMAEEGRARGESAPASPPASADAPHAKRGSNRPGLGTEFGEAMTSPVREVAFVRASSSQPEVVMGMRYNDRPGLAALGIDIDGWYEYSHHEQHLRGTAQPFPVSSSRYAAPPPGWRR